MPHDPRHKSRTLLDGPDRAPARSMLKAIGFSKEDLARPLVAVRVDAAAARGPAVGSPSPSTRRQAS